MYRKKSEITNWWISIEGNSLSFYNILSNRPVKKNLIIVGYFNSQEQHLICSTSPIWQVSSDGVTTLKGEFYPFEEAHPLYLQFLINASNESTVLAYNWRSKKTKNNNLLFFADILDGYTFRKNVKFDFISYEKTNLIFYGFSKKLNSDVIFSTFDRRDLSLNSVSPVVLFDIYKSSTVSLQLREQKIRKISQILSLISPNGFINI